ncbi:MAG: putative dsRNA-binding protein, partial [cyanobacterium endosymbiont of Rhopalodia yunnanensis]
KDALQEWTQAQYKLLPEYRVQRLNSVPTSQPSFLAEVWLVNRKLGSGQGRSKKMAEQAAAQEAFFKFVNVCDT